MPEDVDDPSSAETGVQEDEDKPRRTFFLEWQQFGFKRPTKADDDVWMRHLLAVLIAQAQEDTKQAWRTGAVKSRSDLTPGEWKQAVEYFAKYRAHLFKIKRNVEDDYKAFVEEREGKDVPAD